MKKFLLGRDTLFATFFVFIITGLLGLIVINIHVFDPFKKAFRDFEISDIYYAKIRQEQGLLDTNIVVLNIGRQSRDSIAMMLDKVNAQNPGVVGIDAFFTDRADSSADKLLKKSLASTKNLVLTGVLINDKEGKRHFSGTNPWFGSYTSTYANLTGKENNTTTIREFSPFISEKDTMWSSFAAEIVRKTDPQAWDRLKARNNHREIIHYIGRNQSFICMDVDEVFDTNADLSILRNKIVLMGYLGERIGATPDLEDLHFTPMNPEISGRSNPDMRGVLIHANIISMIMHDDYVDVVPAWINWVLAFVLCFLHIALFIYLYMRKHKWYHFIAKVVQFVTSVILIWIVFLVNENFGLKFSATPAVALILLSMDLLYFYEGMVKFLAEKFKYKHIFEEHQHA